jgi:hypothetical protein
MKDVGEICAAGVNSIIFNMQASLAVDDVDDSTRRRAREIARAARRDRCAPNRPNEFYMQPQKHRVELERRILDALATRFAESELLLCLFSASLYSYRRGTICEPFPLFFEQGERAYDDVVRHATAAECNFYFSRFPLLQIRPLRMDAIQNQISNIIISGALNYDVFEELQAKNIVLIDILHRNCSLEPSQILKRWYKIHN